MGLLDKIAMQVAEKGMPIYEKVKARAPATEILDEMMKQADKAMGPFYKAIESEGSPDEQIEEMGLGRKNRNAKKILVAYYTKHGSTSSIGQAIAHQLADLGFRVDLRPVIDLMGEDLSGYDAYVLGSAIYWAALKETFVKFVEAHSETLQQKPCALFAVCGTIQRDSEKNRKAVNKYIGNSLSLVPEFKPFDIAVFPGKIEYSKMTKPEAMIMRAIIAISPLKSGDQRDMAKVRRWVNGIKDQL